jgi:hypothetical protein
LLSQSDPRVETLRANGLHPPADFQPEPQKIKTFEAPADWFNDCAEGRYRKACIKTEYLDRVDLPDQCTTHQQERTASSG